MCLPDPEVKSHGRYFELDMDQAPADTSIERQAREGTAVNHRTLLLATLVKGLMLATALPAWAVDDAPWATRINAGTLAVISDGDFLAQTYATGRLAPVEAKLRDVLTVLKQTPQGWKRSQIEVSNSVTSAPEILRLSRDGRTAFVTERLAQRPAGATLTRELPPGQRLFAVDLSDAHAPRLADTTQVEAFPEALAVSPDGRHVAVVSNTPQASYVQIAPFDGRRFGVVERFRLDELGVPARAQGPRGGITATNVDWHPSGRVLAVNLNTLNQVAFFRVAFKGGRTTLQAWGAPVAVGIDPFVGRFTPDGHHYLTADWGRDFRATTLEGRLPTRASAISVIRLAPLGAQDVGHRRVGGAPTDLSSEGLAVSPDGRLVATINMRGTALDPASDRFDRQASITLLSFDPQSGSLEKIADHPFEGVLPEGGTFDLSGEHFLAAVFEYHEGLRAGGGLEVFRVRKSERPALERLGRLSFPHGAHHVDLAR